MKSGERQEKPMKARTYIVKACGELVKALADFFLPRDNTRSKARYARYGGRLSITSAFTTHGAKSLSRRTRSLGTLKKSHDSCAELRIAFSDWRLSIAQGAGTRTGRYAVYSGSRRGENGRKTIAKLGRPGGKLSNGCRRCD